MAATAASAGACGSAAATRADGEAGWSDPSEGRGSMMTSGGDPQNDEEHAAGPQTLAVESPEPAAAAADPAPVPAPPEERCPSS